MVHLYQWGRRLECRLWSASCPNCRNCPKCLILAAGIAKCSQQTSSFQVRLHLALPSAHHGKNLTYWATILQLSWSGCQSRSTLSLSASFVCPPLLQYRCTVHRHLCGTQNTWHPRGNIVSKIPNLIWVLPPSPPQLIQPQWLPLSFSLTHRAGTCLPLLASKGNRGGANHMTAKQMWFSSLLLFHAYMQPHSFSIYCILWY